MSYPIYGQPTAADTGTDAPTRTLSETQQPASTSTPPAYVPPFNITGDDNGFPLPQTASQAASNPLGITGDDEGYPLPGSGFGIGSANDDNTNQATAGQILNASASGPVVAQPNVLDQYASYTYSLSWYILTPDQFNELANGEINMNKWLLLMQSGGAQANVNDNGNGGRSPYFTLDYYMDNVILETNMPGGGMGGTMTANLGGKLEFTVTEPNGLTLPNNLALAYQDALKDSAGDQQANYAQALYCMVIKFYGYDDQGNLVQAGRNGNQNGTSSAASPRANVQKIYPFAIQQFDFRLANRVVEYKIQATCPIFTLNASTRRGSIPAQFELVGKSVGDILAGNGSTGTNVTVPGVDGRTPTATVKSTPQTATNAVNANSRDGITSAIFTGGSYNAETGAVGYATGA